MLFRSILFASFLSSVFPMIKSIMEKDITYVFLSFLNSFMFSIALFSIFFPFYFKLGYLKMHVINLIIFYCLIFIPIILNLFKDVVLLKPITNFIFDFVNYLMQNAGAAFVGCLISYLISLMISINFVNNK